MARGIYCYPKIDTELGLGVIYPSFDDIAQAIAKRDKAKIVPAGAYAVNKLGLSTQVPMNAVFLTSGESRKIEIRTEVSFSSTQHRKTSPLRTLLRNFFQWHSKKSAKTTSRQNSAVP